MSIDSNEAFAILKPIFGLPDQCTECIIKLRMNEAAVVDCTFWARFECGGEKPQTLITKRFVLVEATEEHHEPT